MVDGDNNSEQTMFINLDPKNALFIRPFCHSNQLATFNYNQRPTEPSQIKG